MIGGSYKRMSGAGKGESCRGEEGFHLLLLFAERTRLAFSLSMTGKPRRYGGTYGGFIFRGGNNIV